MKKILYGTAVIFLALFVLTACGPKTQAPKAGASPDNLLGMFPADFEDVLSTDPEERRTAIAEQLPRSIVHESWGDGRIVRLAASFV